MRREDLRIARKHRIEAGDRVMTDANVAAYKRACSWERACQIRETHARAAVIRTVAS